MILWMDHGKLCLGNSGGHVFCWGKIQGVIEVSKYVWCPVCVMQLFMFFQFVGF